MTANTSPRRGTVHSLASAAGSSGAVMAIGVGTIAAGAVVLAWPEATLKVIAVVFGISAIVDGVVRLVSAVSAGDRSAAQRTLPVLAGVLSILVGIVFVRYPFPTLAALTLLLGMFWVVAGLVQIVHGLAERETGSAWRVASGALALVTGILVLAYTSASLVVLVWILGLQLVLGGALLFGWGLEVRREEHGTMPRHGHRSAEA
ncbi:HdeD family acid-resistance protein [Amycolatopsis sp. 3B14]|uniref:HdeD family acid-resistance protein n=1 Tax=Amycolatopsis sp. 3B14 TaxID=3243600 RepID=UPI003D96FB4D